MSSDFCINRGKIPSLQFVILATHYFFTRLIFSVTQELSNNTRSQYLLLYSEYPTQSFLLFEKPSFLVHKKSGYVQALSQKRRRYTDEVMCLHSVFVRGWISKKGRWRGPSDGSVIILYFLSAINKYFNKCIIKLHLDLYLKMPVSIFLLRNSYTTI